MKNRSNVRLLLSGALMVGVLASGSAFTASNTLPADTHAGSGTVAVSGYTATSINYNLAADKAKIATIDIVINSEVDVASNAHLQLATGGTWYDCTVGVFADGETSLNCDTLDADVNTATDLTLVITD